MGSMAANNVYYNVQWEGYDTNVRSILSDAWHSKFYTDITIVAENRAIKCHKLVLAKNIQFFREMLAQEFMDDKPVIVAVRAPYELMNAILTFTYVGAVQVLKSDLHDLMRLADELGVLGLMDSDDVSPVPEQPPLTPSSSSVLCAAEALQNLGKAPRVADRVVYKYHQVGALDYHVVPKQPDTEQRCNQPSTGEQPPTAQQDQVDFQSLHYKAAASRKSSSRSPTPCGASRDRKRICLSQNNSFTASESPDYRKSPPTISGSTFYLTKQEEPDSEDSDGELQIDEGCDQPSPMEYLEEQMFVDDQEPEDLRVEARQQHSEIGEAVDCKSHLSSELSTSSSLYLPASSATVFPSPALNKVVLHTSPSTTTHNSPSATSHFITSTLGEVTSHNVPKKKPNGISLCINSSLSGNTKFVTLPSHSLNNLPIQSSTCSPDGGLMQVNINNNETKGVYNNKLKVPMNGSKSQGGKSNEKSYTYEQLTEAVEVVIEKRAQPVDSINLYNIPRRTFFRHLKQRRIELGIQTNDRSKPSSRATSPSSSSSSGSAGLATPLLTNNFQHNVPASGTQLHAMLKSFSVPQSSTPVILNSNVVKQEPEYTTNYDDEEQEETSSFVDNKDNVFALLKKTVENNYKKISGEKSSGDHLKAIIPARK